ncbi:uncharacterized protein LOC114271591 [Camellia sinensis]|uniref:uncharacterized protein LOC114271591 n=1 Tax=Camellia sinensis TaxID=4442 RepID=UPI001036E96F|nr:uncharacterized protein LOC114271591 [Camellia sinensis]
MALRYEIFEALWDKDVSTDIQNIRIMFCLVFNKPVAPTLELLKKLRTYSGSFGVCDVDNEESLDEKYKKLRCCNNPYPYVVKNEDSGSPSWSASLFMQTIEDVARAVAAAAAAATTVRSPRPYVVFSSKDDNGNSPLHKLQHQVSRVLKGFSQPPEVKSGTYNPEVLTSQKRQWASVQLQSLDHRPLKEPSRLFESMVVVGLHPNCDIQALQKQYFGRKSEGSGKFRSALSGQHQSRVEPNLEPQVLILLC